jgi:hypothetical protein
MNLNRLAGGGQGVIEFCRLDGGHERRMLDIRISPTTFILRRRPVRVSVNGIATRGNAGHKSGGRFASSIEARAERAYLAWYGRSCPIFSEAESFRRG